MVSKVQSLKLDTSVWSNEIVQVNTPITSVLWPFRHAIYILAAITLWEGICSYHGSQREAS